MQLKPNTHLVLVEGIRDVIGHVTSRVRQNDDHMVARGGRRSQPVCLGLDMCGQPVSAELIFCLTQTWGHLT